MIMANQQAAAIAKEDARNEDRSALMVDQGAEQSVTHQADGIAQSLLTAAAAPAAGSAIAEWFLEVRQDNVIRQPTQTCHVCTTISYEAATVSPKPQ